MEVDSCVRLVRQERSTCWCVMTVISKMSSDMFRGCSAVGVRTLECGVQWAAPTCGRGTQSSESLSGLSYRFIHFHRVSCIYKCHPKYKSTTCLHNAPHYGLIMSIERMREDVSRLKLNYRSLHVNSRSRVDVKDGIENIDVADFGCTRVLAWQMGRKNCAELWQSQA